jgi:hypothetical protein
MYQVKTWFQSLLFPNATCTAYGAGKQVSCIDWQHSKRGVVAVSCTEPLSFEERVEAAGKSKPGAVLIWNFVDPIHPQYVLEASTVGGCTSRIQFTHSA